MCSRANNVFHYMRRNNSLGSNFIKYSQLYFTFSKAMNKIISTKERVFISLVGPSGSGKKHLIFEWLKTGISQPKFDKFVYFCPHYQPLMDKCKEKTLGLSRELTLN